jgi:hypothetical protein
MELLDLAIVKCEVIYESALREIVENIWNIEALADVLVEMGHIRL